MYHVYVIRNKITDHEYIGSTRNELRVRLYQHKNKKKKNLTKLQQLMAEFGKNNFFIELLESKPFTTMGDRMKLEGEYIVKSRDRIGDLCLNIVTPCGLDPLEYNRFYKSEHKDRVSDSNRRYRDKNPQKIREWKQIGVSCLYCRKTYNLGAMPRHCRTKRHKDNMTTYLSKMN